jgi:hypothetical protein
MAMLTRTAAAIVAALLALPLGACTPEGPAASATETPCHTLARVAMDDYGATPATRELALELLRVRCLGMTADGSRQLRPGSIGILRPRPMTSLCSSRTCGRFLLNEKR